MLCSAGKLVRVNRHVLAGAVRRVRPDVEHERTRVRRLDDRLHDERIEHRLTGTRVDARVGGHSRLGPAYSFQDCVAC